MVATEAIYVDAKGEITELGDPTIPAFLAVPAGGEIPPHIEEQMKKKAAPKVPKDASAKIASRQKHVVTPPSKRR
jgi:hypothetical protein